MDNEPWDSWKSKTDLEQRAIASLRRAKKIILENIPREEIAAIYVKGSFVRREMNEKSDVDTLTIVKHSKTLTTLRKLEEEYRRKFRPQIQLTGYSLWELRNNKLTGNTDKLRASPSRTSNHLQHFIIIYGKPLDYSQFKRRDPKKQLEALIGAFNNIFLPHYHEGKLGFSEIAKQVFWLAENEQRYLGHEPPYSWKKLVLSIKDKQHIVHDAYRYRLSPTKNERRRAAFIRKLEDYLANLKENIK